MWSRRSAIERCRSSATAKILLYKAKLSSSGGTTSLDRRLTTPHVLFNSYISPTHPQCGFLKIQVFRWCGRRATGRRLSSPKFQLENGAYFPELLIFDREKILIDFDGPSSQSIIFDFCIWFTIDFVKNSYLIDPPTTKVSIPCRDYYIAFFSVSAALTYSVTRLGRILPCPVPTWGYFSAFGRARFLMGLWAGYYIKWENDTIFSQKLPKFSTGAGNLGGI